MTHGPWLSAVCLALALGGCLGQTRLPSPSPVVVAPSNTAGEVLKTATTSDGFELETTSGAFQITTPRADTDFRLIASW